MAEPLDCESLINTTLHSLTFRSVGKKTRAGRQYFFFECKCSNIKEIAYPNVRDGTTKSCGCMKKGYTNGKVLPAGEAAGNVMFNSYIKQAKRKDREFLITKEQFDCITKQNCHYCGIPPSPYKKPNHYNGGYIGNGIDRKDNTVGYVIENCLPCCTVCNYMKRNMDYTDFINHLKRAGSYQLNLIKD